MIRILIKVLKNNINFRLKKTITISIKNLITLLFNDVHFFDILHIYIHYVRLLFFHHNFLLHVDLHPY